MWHHHTVTSYHCDITVTQVFICGIIACQPTKENIETGRERERRKLMKMINNIIIQNYSNKRVNKGKKKKEKDKKRNKQTKKDEISKIKITKYINKQKALDLAI